MEECFLIKEFEDGYDIHDLIHEDIAYCYCEEVLEIPEEKIESIQMTDEGMEIQLQSLEVEDIQDDWFVNLHKITRI